MNIPILFQDARFVVLNKPAGLPVHPGRAGGPSVEDSFAQLSRRADGPWLAHRLDADTSGCLVIALRRAALLEAIRGDLSGGSGTGSSDDIGSECSDVSDGEGGS